LTENSIFHASDKEKINKIYDQTIYKRFLKDILEEDRMAVIDTWTEENYDECCWRIRK
jgi:hypothetical protein